MYLIHWIKHLLGQGSGGLAGYQVLTEVLKQLLSYPRPADRESYTITPAQKSRRLPRKPAYQL
jgi:hypothetical protein